MQTVTRAQLAETIYTQVGLSRNESADLLETVLERMAATLELGDSVKISGFGTVSVRPEGRPHRPNPKAREASPAPPPRRPGVPSPPRAEGTGQRRRSRRRRARMRH